MTVINGYEVEILDEAMDDWLQEDMECEKQLMELSMNAYLGIDTPTTTKIRGRIGLQEVVIMIDSGATHNFLVPHVVMKAKLPLQSEKRFQVLLGTGVVVESLGVCPQVPFMIQDTLFTTDFVTLEKGGAYMILGV